MRCVSSCFLAFSIAFSLKTSFSALSHKAPAFIYIGFISFIATDLRPRVLSLSTIHIHLNQLVFHHLCTKRPQARFLSHSLLIYIRTPRNSQRATRSTAHLAGAPRILPRLIDPWCFVLFLCRALHSIATYELITEHPCLLCLVCSRRDAAAHQCVHRRVPIYRYFFLYSFFFFY